MRLTLETSQEFKASPRNTSNQVFTLTWEELKIKMVENFNLVSHVNHASLRFALILN